MKSGLKNRVSSLFLEFERAFKIRYLGLPLAWAWVYCSYQTSAVFSEPEGLSIRSDDTWLVSATVVIIMLIIGGILLRKSSPLTQSPLYIVSSILLSLGIVISALPPFAFGLSVYLSGIFTGSATALLTISWVIALSYFDVEKLEIIIPLAPLVTILCAMIFPSLHGIAGVITTASLPLLSGFFLFLTKRELKAEEQTPMPAINLDKKTRVFLLKVSLLSGITYFVIGWQDALSVPTDALQDAAGFDVLTMLGSLVGIILAYIIVFFSRRIDFAALFRWLVPLLSISLIFFALDSVFLGSVNIFLLILCGSLLQAITLIYIITLAKRGILHASLGYGMTQAFMQLGVLFGNVLGNSLLSDYLEGSKAYFLLLLVMIGLVAFSSILVPQRDDHAAEGGTTGFSSYTEEQESILVRFARKHGLSERETDILDYLIKGRSQPHIREALLISKNTVSTHVKHIYSKLCVHSRQELIDLYEDFSERHVI